MIAGLGWEARVRGIWLTLLIGFVLAAAPAAAQPRVCGEARTASEAAEKAREQAAGREQAMAAQITGLRSLMARGPNLTDVEIKQMLYLERQRREDAEAYYVDSAPLTAENFNEYLRVMWARAAVAYLEKLQVERALGGNIDPNDNPAALRLATATGQLAGLKAQTEQLRETARTAQLAAIDCIVRSQPGPPPPQVAEQMPPAPPTGGETTQSQTAEAQQPEALANTPQPRTGGRIRFRPMAQSDANAMAATVDPGGGRPQEMADLALAGFWEVQTMQNGPWEAVIEIVRNPMSERWQVSHLRTGRVSGLKARGNNVITADEWLLEGTVSADGSQIRWNNGETWRRTSTNPILTMPSPRE